MNGFLNQSIRFGDPLLTTRDSSFINGKFHLDDDLIIRNFPSMGASTVDYLDFIEKYVPEDLISQNNFSQLKNIAGNFSGGLTSFFGFESRLNSIDARSDYLFAVSSENGERETLSNVIKRRNLPEAFLNQPEWQNIGNFADAWADPNSILYGKILGIWFEFDVAHSNSEVTAPSIFLQLKPLRIDAAKDISKCKWLTCSALPLLTGKHLPNKVEENVINCIQKMPPDASLLHVGIMLSRPTSRIRLCINKIRPKQIIPYLTAIGWQDSSNELSSLLNDLENYFSFNYLHIDVGESLGKKIGVECSYYPHEHYLEKRWSDFLNYLIEKELCLPEKRSSLIRFTGIETENNVNDFDPELLIPTTKIPDDNYSNAIVRYISHVKIVYQSGHPLEVKAYLGVRHFGIVDSSSHEHLQTTLKK